MVIERRIYKSIMNTWNKIYDWFNNKMFSVRSHFQYEDQITSYLRKLIYCNVNFIAIFIIYSNEVGAYVEGFELNYV